MKILFVTHHYPNYVPDLLLHGLRKLLGHRVVDYPRKDCLYEGYLGTGVSDESLLLKGWFPEDRGIDREDIRSKVEVGFFTYIIIDIRSAQTFFRSFNIRAIKSLIVLIDGEDAPQRIPAGNYVICQRETDGSDYSIPLPMAMPEEVMRIITGFDNLSKRYPVGFLGSVSALCDERRVFVESIMNRYPDALLQTSVIPTEAAPMPQGRLGRLDYYSALQQCRAVINLKGAGYDTFRFWENCACSSVHISQRMPIYIPNDFREGVELLRFSNAEELTRHIDCVIDGAIDTQEMLHACRERLENLHLTTKRAEYLLRKLRFLTW